MKADNWFPRAPLFPVAAGLVLGVVLDRNLAPTVGSSVAAFGVVTILALLAHVRRRLGFCLVFVAALAVGAALHGVVARRVPPNRIDRFALRNGSIVRVTGRVLGEPQRLTAAPHPFQPWTFASERTGFLLEIDSIEGKETPVAVSGRIRVTVGQAVLDLRAEERVELFGWLYALSPPQNPGGFDWESFYRRQGVVARMVCDGRENVQSISDPRERKDPGLILRLRTRARHLLIEDLLSGAPEEASLLEAMVLGHRSRFDRRLNDVFVRAGVIHFIAVSGTNVAILMTVVWLVGRMFRRTKRQCTALMVVSILTYACVADPRPPILRATIMGLLYCAALLLNRPTSHLNWMSAAAALLVVIDPQTVFDVGFQLSFAAVLAVAYLGPALARTVPRGWDWFNEGVLGRPFGSADRRLAQWAADQQPGLPTAVRRMRRWAVRGLTAALAVSVAAWLATVPIVTSYFYQLQPWSPLNTLVVFSLMSVVMVLGLLKVLFGLLSPTLSSLIGALLGPIDALLLAIVEALSRLPGAAAKMAPPTLWLTVTYYAFFIALVLWDRLSSPSKQPQAGWVSGPTLPGHAWSLRLLWASGLAFGIAVAVWVWPEGNRDQLVATILSVGRGSATVIELPDGSTILYDAGTSYPSDAGRNVIVPFLAQRGIHKLDRIYISHPNLDHFSGVPTVLDEIDSGPVVFNACFEAKSSQRSPSRHLLELLSERGQAVEILDGSQTRWQLGGADFELLWPLGSCDADWSSNDSSTVLRISYQGRSLLLTGDIEADAQRALLQRGDLRADVLILPHHGGVESTTAAFLDSVRPSAVIRSSHERMDEAYHGIERLVGSAALFNTADVGAVEVTLDRNGVRIASSRGPG